MKCRQIHLGCLLNLFVGAEWLPNDGSSLSLKHPAHGNLGIWLIRHFRDLWLSICWGRNKDRQLRADPEECWTVYYSGFVVNGKSFLRPQIHRSGYKPFLLILLHMHVHLWNLHQCVDEIILEHGCQLWLKPLTTKIFNLCTDPKDNICSGITAFSSR